MEITTMSPEAWARLGGKIREAREALGYSRKRLSDIAGVSEKSIQVAEEGRAPRSRWPQSLTLIEEAIGWARGSMKEVLMGGEPSVLFEQPALPLSPPPAPASRYSDGEQILSGYMAEDVFVRQMKRMRARLGLSPDDVIQRLAQKDLVITKEQLAEIEDGVRPVRPAEAQVLAAALGSTVERILGSSFMGEDDQLKAPPAEQELTIEAKALQRRMAEAGAHVVSAQHELQMAKDRALYAEHQLRSAQAMSAELERQYYYTLGRIDALRSERGEEEVMQASMKSRPDRAGDFAGKAMPKNPTKEALSRAGRKLL
jgi:transcriptional regulator with XRE-family HTH domain